MKFYLKRLPSGRIYMSQIAPTEAEDVIDEIDAEKWIAARETVSDLYEHRPGHGFFD